ncbi:MAG: amidohydrolase family protein [Acidobacteria bacterium]|nr:amidohydrolase family protein [Acidobacteriota bacterium]MBK8313282.1 amidohydrolase family protein [Acidobacteriota bacterium]MBK9708941.1 amidohydrolase family protein [Acidobacteriota bacterium]
MWIRKSLRDKLKGVDSPMPTQAVSNEEFVPRHQTNTQKHVEQLIGEMSTERAKKLGLERRDFMRTSMGMATCFLASNIAFGKNYYDVDEAETWEPAAYNEKWPKSEYFIIDVQAHFTNGMALNFRNSEFMKNMGFDLKNDSDAYSYKTFVKEMYLDSETSLVVISGVPSIEYNKDKDGKLLEGKDRSPRGILPSWLMSQAAKEINTLAGSQRALSQGNLGPNHYWDKVTDKMDKALTLEQMEREVKKYGISSWKWYCHADPGRTGKGFQLDDENAMWFYEQSRKLGVKLVSVHKGYSYQSRTLGHLANPKDVEKAALQNPDFNFVVYHSAIKHGPGEQLAPGEAKDSWVQKNLYNPTTGDFEWHSVLMDIKKRNPNMKNVYAEIGSFFGPLSIAHPEMAMHGIGKNIKHFGSDHVVWGTDCLWWGSPQWVIEAFKRFQISDEFCEKFGYKKITKEDKAKIFGLNAAKLYNVNVKAKRNPMPADTLDRLKTAYLENGGQRSNAAYGWVRADD